jgi:uncharacterized protein
MTSQEHPLSIPVDGKALRGTLITPGPKMPGIVLVHGWGGDQNKYLSHAREIASLGCVCLTFDLRGHAETEPLRDKITPEQNFADLLCAYDSLLAHHSVDRDAIGLIGSSYGAYLAACLTKVRPVKWLGLRVPALYKDEHWTQPKVEIDRSELRKFRSEVVSAEASRALEACSQFNGDVLIVESEQDDFVPHAVISSYRKAFANSRSLTYRLMDGADHSLQDAVQQRAYSSILVNWATEMIIGSRDGAEAVSDIRGVPQKETPTEA